MTRRLLRAAFAILLLLAPSAQAAIEVVSTTTLTTGVVAPPVRFELGAAGSLTRYFSPFTLSTNATVVSGTVLGRAGADWYAKDALRLVNARTSSQPVVIEAVQLSNAQLDLFKWHVYDGTTLVATLDMEAASPSVSFTIPASTTYRLDLRLDLADGTGAHNAPSSFTLQLSAGSGGIAIEHTTSAPSLAVRTVEVPFGKLATGSAVGANATNATASIAAGVVLAATTNAFYLNNTNASAAWYVKLVYVASSGIASLSTGNVGVDNGTAVEHIQTSSGSVTKSQGSYQRLEPSSTNRIYVRSLEGVLFSSGSIDFDVYVSDSSTGDSYLVSKARVTLT